ncbi:hypothetical protein [Nocardioides sp.]|uniref:hypothetical protein n=1 Tax=Nocardioides sp. TaxID=35761 RepID=UPI002C9964A5|nr:hypothetical protein [Nocardioides sp.]HXH79904.1 hypothetical protein [Nocardioides sp.]
MSDATYVVVLDGEWQFDARAMLALLQQVQAPAVFREVGDELSLISGGSGPHWEASITPDRGGFVVKGSPRDTADIVAWVRGYVPSHVDLEMFDEDVTGGPVLLSPGVTANYVGETMFGNDWTSTAQKSWEPPTLEERMGAGPPLHVREALEKQRESQGE